MDEYLELKALQLQLVKPMTDQWHMIRQDMIDYTRRRRADNARQRARERARKARAAGRLVSTHEATTMGGAGRS